MPVPTIDEIEKVKTHGRALHGSLADAGPKKVITMSAYGKVQGAFVPRVVPVGNFINIDPADGNNCVPLAASSEKFYGVVLTHTTGHVKPNLSVPAYSEYEPVNVLIAGSVVLRTVETLAKNDPIGIQLAKAANKLPGQVVKNIESTLDTGWVAPVALGAGSLLKVTINSGSITALSVIEVEA